MKSGTNRSSWAWRRGKVDRSLPHISLTFGDPNSSTLEGFKEIAFVSPPEEACFTVEFVVPESDPLMKGLLDKAIKELDYYLVEKGERDPWAYAIYHCSTTANLYSSVRWNASAGTIPNWNGTQIQIGRSRGGVLAVSHPFDNLIRPERIAWPPLEIVQKLYKSRQGEAFKGLDSQAVIYGLGYYCDLQSLQSEDALTWSVFGTLQHSSGEQREAWTQDFFGLLGLDSANPESAEISLWRRTPHPDNLSQGGPEVDFSISTKNAIIFGETKWLSKIGKAQGKEKGKDQLQICQEVLEKYGHKFFRDKTVKAIVCIGLALDTFGNRDKSDIFLRSVTWDQVCSLALHPNADEVMRYFVWKKGHTGIGDGH